MEKDEGRFFYMNDILCKTFGADGSFRPSDIFNTVEADFSLASLTHSPVASGIEQADDEAHTVVDGRDANTLTASVRPNLDDTILNSFGVLSKGVLMDPWNGCFVDFTDSQVFTPSLFYMDESSCLSFHEAKALEGVSLKKQSCSRKHSKQAPPTSTPEKLHNRNECCYRAGEFECIRAQACLILCSSLEPLDSLTSGDAWRATTPRSPVPLLWPYCNKFFSYAALNGIVKQYVEWIFAACEFPHTAVDPESHCHHLFLHYLTLMEKYRMLLKLRKPQSTYLPAGVPFPFQYQGLALQDCARDKELETNDSSMESCGKMLMESNSPLIQSSSASSFSCFTGKISMCRGGYNTIRTDMFFRERISSTVSNIRKSVTPLRALGCKRARDMLNEIQRPYLHPPKQLSQWARAWWLFRVYFNYLGIVVSPSPSQPGARGGATTEWVAAKNSEPSRVEYKLCPDVEFSISAQVHRKCFDREKLQHTQGQDLDALRSVSNLIGSEIADAWNFMICHKDRERLLNRLWKLEKYLEELDSSTHKRRKTEADSA